MDIAVVILNWNGLKMLQTYLPTLVERTSCCGSFIVVADNGSTDGSVDWLKEAYPEIRTLCFDRNYGFTGGYNRALREIDADYYILLNSDIEVGEGWLEPLVSFMEEHPDVGICQPKVLSMAERDRFEYAGAAGGFIDRYGYPFCRGRILSNLEKDQGQYDTPEECFWATGACMMVRSALYHHLGGLDDSFFAHMEEIDFCWRAKLLGYQVWCVPASTVWHVGGRHPAQQFAAETLFQLPQQPADALQEPSGKHPQTPHLYQDAPRRRFRRRLSGNGPLEFLQIRLAGAPRLPPYAPRRRPVSIRRRVQQHRPVRPQYRPALLPLRQAPPLERH